MMFPPKYTSALCNNYDNEYECAYEVLRGR